MKILKYKKNITLEYLHTFLRNVNLSNGIWLLFLAFKGFSLFQIGMVETVFHLTSLTMEVPTGIIADLYGRKFSRTLGIISYFIYIALMILSSNFILIALAFFFCGLSYTFESGSGEALVYDSLIFLKKEDDYMKVNGKKEVLFQLGSSISLFVGGYIAMVSFNLTFEITALFYFLALMVILLMHETPLAKRKKHHSFKDMMIEHYVKSTKVVFQSKRLLYLIIIGAMMAAPITVLFMYLQNYLNLLGYSYFIIGVLLGVHSLLAAFGGILAYKLEKKYQERKILIIVPLLMTVSFWLILVDEIIFLPFIFLGFLDSIFYVVLTGYINKIIPSETRATALSFSGLMFSIIMIIIFPIIGMIGDLYSLKISFFILAIIMSIFYFFLLNILRKNHLKIN